MAAIIPTLVPRAVVPSAMAWFASANQTGQIVGPALGGVLYLLGPTTVYGVTIVLWGLGGVMLALMRVERGPRSTEPFSLRSLMGGFRFVRHDRIILGTMSLDMFAVFLGGATALLPIFARDILLTGPWGLGLLRAAPAIGALTMSIILARRPLTLPVGRVLFSVLTIYGLAVTVLCVLHRAVAVDGGAGRDGRGRRGQRRDPLLAGSASHAAADARPGQRGQWAVHRHLQPARRFPRRRDGRRCSGRFRRWRSAAWAPYW